ncbi:MAG: helix-turn-helix transcriptional regulator [Candidatus Woesearchaeota archaeon]
MQLILPEKALLTRYVESLNSPISPKPFSVGTNGRQIIITWKETEPSGAFSIFVAYENKNSFPWILLLEIILIILGVIGFFYHKKKIRKELMKRKRKRLKTIKTKGIESKDDKEEELKEEKEIKEAIVEEKEKDINHEKLDAIKITLNENQLKIIEALLQKDGEASQTQIQYLTGVPKSSLSRNLEILAQKQVISKFYNGTSNYLKIHPSLYKEI